MESRVGFVMGNGVSPGRRASRVTCSGRLETFAAASIGVCLIGFSQAWAAPDQVISQGEDIFKAQCAACHLGGGNIIPYARGKTLKQKALTKNKMDSTENIVNLMRNGKGAMPIYAGKLGDEELEAVAKFVLAQAEAGWP
uniref:Cytochrome c-553 n=1 Tax=Rhodosorus marinus TaxID=101924 RepID=A0A7S3EJH7_9RHOD|mmetsp:Transcript_41354/g.162942  ORF Transcript_41354/g.162942 Transcript_41354/m.162942 type:complete len:140 (+) Transcript_41354:158-577(+)